MEGICPFMKFMTRLLSLGDLARRREEFLGRLREELWEEVCRVCGAGRGVSALDISSADGGAAPPLAGRGARVVSLRVPPEESRGSGFSIVNDPPIAFPAVAADRLAFRSEAFDLVVFSSLLHRITSAMRLRLWFEAARVIRPGGLLVVADYRMPRAPVSRMFLKLGLLHEFRRSPNFPGFCGADLAGEASGAGLDLFYESPVAHGLYKVSAFLKSPGERSR